jgi:hypothetical protein
MGRKKGSASWHEQTKALKAEAEKLPSGKEREALETKARQLEIAANINQWLSSPGLQPPQNLLKARSTLQNLNDQGLDRRRGSTPSGIKAGGKMALGNR